MECPYFVNGCCQQASEIADGLEIRPSESACRVCQTEDPPMSINKVTVSLAISALAKHDREKMNHIVAAYHHLLSANPSLRQKATRYTLAVTKWIKAGRPRRSPDHILYLLQHVCKPCMYYRNQNSSCGLCGCQVNNSTLPLANKLAMATEECPIRRFRAMADFSQFHVYLLTPVPGLEGWLYDGAQQHCASVSPVRAMLPSQLINYSQIPSEVICNFRNMQRLCEAAIVDGHEYVLLGDTRLLNTEASFDKLVKMVQEAPADWDCLLLAYDFASGEIQLHSQFTYIYPSYVRCPALWVSNISVIKQYYLSMSPYRWDFGIGQLNPKPRVYAVTPPLVRVNESCKN